LKVHNFYLTQKSVFVCTVVYSIRFPTTNSPAAGTGVVHSDNSKGSVLASYSATDHDRQECRQTKNRQEWNAKSQQYMRGADLPQF